MRRPPPALLARYVRYSGRVVVVLELFEGNRRWQTRTTYRGETRAYACHVLEPEGLPTARGASRAAAIVLTLQRLDWPQLARAAVWSPTNDLAKVTSTAPVLLRRTEARRRAA